MMELTVYYARSDGMDEDTMHALLGLMPAERKARLTAALRSSSAESVALAYGLLRYTMLLQGFPEIPRIAIAERGKPYFASETGYHFNLSHTRGYALCAVYGEPVGCDIECRRDPREAAARKVFSQEEYLWWGKSEDKQEAFIRLWTLKESIGKLTGEGIRYEKPDFAVSPSGELVPINEKLHIKTFDIGEAVISVCAPCPIETEPVELLPIMLTI